MYPASTGILGLIWFLNLICSIEVHLSFWFRFLWSRVELVIIVRGLCSNLGLLFQYKNFHYLLHVKNIKQIFIIKNVIKPNLFLIFLLPYTHLMGQPTFACWYLARATAKITEPKIWLNYTTIHKVHFIYNKPEYNNTLAFSLNLTFVNKSILFFSELQNKSSQQSNRDWQAGLNEATEYHSKKQSLSHCLLIWTIQTWLFFTRLSTFTSVLLYYLIPRYCRAVW